MSSADWAQLLPLVLIAVVFWLLILRPARRRQQDAARLQRGLAVGDRVLLTSGLFGTITGLGEETFDLEVAAGVVLTVHRQAVAKVVEPAVADDEPPATDEGPAGVDGDDGAPRATDHRSDQGGNARP